MLTVMSPLIDEIPFLNTLIIDNQPDDIDVKSLEDDLRKRNMSVTLAKTSTEAETILKLRPELDLVILDWLLNEEDDIEAKDLLKSLKNRTFAPIIVYTDKGTESPSKYIKEQKLDRIARVLNKSDVKGARVFSEIEQWLTQNPELRIFMRWAHEVENRLNETLWTIHDLEIGGVRALIDLLKPSETLKGHAHITREQDLVNFFGRVLTRKLGSDERFLNLIKNDVEVLLKIREKAELDLDKMRAFHSFERYRLSNPASLWTGSILKKNAETYFVVVTPACDLCSIGKIENILLIKAEPLKKYRRDRALAKETVKSCMKNSTDCVHYLPYAADLPDGLICRFDGLYNIKKEQLKKILDGGKMTCIAIIDSPFVENLMQRMNSYLMRLGVRDLNKAEITKILNETT